MTTFPSYRPTSLPLQHGTFPASVQQTASGRTAIVRHSELETDIILPLEFILTQAQFLVVWEHHREHGTFLSFPLPSTIPASYTPTGYRWKYASEPVQVKDAYTDLFIVSCTFVGNLWSDIRLPSELGTLEMVAVETAIANVRTTAPAAPTATVQDLASGVTSNGFVEVTGLEVGTPGSTPPTAAAPGRRARARDSSSRPAATRRGPSGSARPIGMRTSAARRRILQQWR